jgi:protoporphyrinogen oxidase
LNGSGRVLILGAGPCGLACAYRLSELGHDWVLAEASDRVGGAAASVLDKQGFTWEFGGHVIFSKIKAFNRLLADVIPADQLLEHRRSSAISFGDRMIPYPFQRHLRHLPYREKADAVRGLLATLSRTTTPPSGRVSYAEWLSTTFGDGLMRHFFEPYNAKIWSVALTEMSADWISSRVAPIDWEAVLTDLVLGQDPPDWGPNQRFLFPRQGGIGHVWSALAERLPRRPRFGIPSVGIDWKNKHVSFADGTEESYTDLISTIPLDVLVGQLDPAPDELRRVAGTLRHTTVRIVGLGYELPTTSEHNWLYFPELDVPFYRASNPAKNAPSNVPGGDTRRYSSWLLEMTGKHAEIDPDAAIAAAERGLRQVGLVPPDAEPISRYTDLIERAYPVPTLDRDDALALIQPWLAANHIYSRGRMGTWRYELGNVDHAVKMGLEIAEFLVQGTPELLIQYPAS